MSIRDDLFALEDFFSKKKNAPMKESWERVREWAIDCENESERLRPIVGKMREAIGLMFE
jgi:hypothetical protein